MKLATFETKDGRRSWGVIEGDNVIGLDKCDGGRFPTLKSALGDANLLHWSRNHAISSRDIIPLSAVKLLIPVPDAEKFICIGLNYKAHAAEAGLALPKFPQTFFRMASSVVPHDAAIVRPRLSTDFDYEGELAVIIGKGGHHITASRALEHVAGYTCFNDGSIRNYQFDHGLSVGKNFFATGSIGPWIVTADEIPDPGQLDLKTRVNGKEVQSGNTSDLIFSVPEIIAYVSSFIPLAEGDLIATGTPHGVGFKRAPPLWLKPDDVVEIEISKIGTLRNGVAQGA
jgi:2-keto-4-pentenoate hydratase/2-oxohepta-3-ene-1,7-dioic acid hydratase in catechol pathway